MTEPNQPAGYRMYMLRYWEVRNQRTGLPQAWRFSLEDPETGKRIGFPDLHSLFIYLQGEADLGEQELAEIAAAQPAARRQ